MEPTGARDGAGEDGRRVAGLDDRRVSGVTDRRASGAGDRRGAPDLEDRRDELADRITEQAVQLLYTARQDIAEACEGVTEDGTLQRAQFRVLDAIEVLRRVATEVRSPGWDLSVPSPRRSPQIDRAGFEAAVREHHEARSRWAGAREAREQARDRRGARRSGRLSR